MTRERFLYLVVLILLFFIGATQFISDSEFWPVTLAHEFGSTNSLNLALYYKYFFHGLLKLPYLLPLTNSQHVLVVRLMMTGFGVATIVLFYLIVLRVYGSRQVAFWSSALLLSMQTFFSQYSRIRSDMLTAFLILLSFWLILGIAERKKFRARDGLVLGILTTAALLCTPKAIYWIFLGGIFFYMQLDFLSSRIKRVVFVLGSYLFPLSLFTLTICFIKPHLIKDFSDAWVNALLYYEVASLKSFSDVLHLLTFDIGTMIFVILALGVALVRIFKKQNMSVSHKACVRVSLFAIFFLLIHNQKMVFFIAALMPFIFLSAGFLVELILRQKIWIVAAGPFLIMKLYSCFLFPSSYWYPNWGQLNKIKEIEETLAVKEDPLVFDGMGVLPRFRNVYVYLEPFENRDLQELTLWIKEHHPDVVLWNSRSPILYPYLAKYLEEEFTEVSPGLWGRKGEGYSGKKDSSPVWKLFTYEPPSLYSPESIF